MKRRVENECPLQGGRKVKPEDDMTHVLCSSRFFGVYMHDFEGNFLEANDASLNRLGYSREELRSVNIASLLCEEELEMAVTTLDEIKKTGHQQILTRYKLKSKQGDFIWVETEGFLVHRQGRPYAIQGIARDVTDQIRAEVEVRSYQARLEELVERRTLRLKKTDEKLRRGTAEKQQVEETLAESEERYRRLTESIKDMIWISDAEGKILYVNRAVERILGTSPEDAIGVSNYSYLSPDSLQKTVEWVLEAETAAPRQDSYHGEVECIHKDGRKIPCEVNATILRDGDGKITGYEGVTRDISRRKRAEEATKKLNLELEEKVNARTEELEQAYNELKRLDKTKDEFLALVSHELRTPLTSIRSFSEILLRYENEPETQKEFLSIINTESERLTRLINNLLDFSKIEAGAVTWHDGTISVEAVVEDAGRALQHLFLQKGLEWRVDAAPGLPFVYADRDRVQQVVTNLLSNAIKFSNEGGEILARVEGLEGKRSREYSRWIKVSVHDQGIGIDEENFEIIFHRFRQISADHGREKPKGTGLGLPICKEIISHYGGNIWVESKKGKGSTFCFTLPQILPPSKS
jgi:PAS domain S-box-containing protein